MMGRSVKVAAVQMASVSFDLSASLEKLAGLVKEAKDRGAQLVVFPEAFLSAYPRYLDFVIGTRTDENREWFRRYVESSVRVPSGAIGKPFDTEVVDTDDDFKAFRCLQAIAASNQVVGLTLAFLKKGRVTSIWLTPGEYLSVGVVERSLVGATLWCTLLLFAPTGTLLSRHRKLQPTAAERIVWHQGHGTTDGQDNLPVVQTDIGRLGGLICWENYMPLARYLLYKKGVDIYLAPTADGRTTWMPTMQHIAQEGRCFVVSVNQYQASRDFPADYPHNLKSATQASSSTSNGIAQSDMALAPTVNGTAELGAGSAASGKAQALPESEAWCRGGSCIVGPLGQILAGPLWDKEGIITADLDLDQSVGAKVDFDAVGHYSREELLVDLLRQ